MIHTRQFTQLTIMAASIAAAFVATPSFAADEVQSVVVSAQSRKQLASDVPIAMQVITSKDIANIGAKDLGDLNGYIPGLSVDNSEPTQPSFGIRGVQPGDFGIATDSPVGIYVDGVYTGKTGGALMNFVDVQRIEVIKGPQGTLFGRNSAAGAISIVTNEPDKDLDASAMVRLGNFGRKNFEGIVNMPITNSLAARLVLVRDGSDGWGTNTYNGQKIGGDKSWAGRLTLRQDLGTGSKIVFSWEHERMDQDGRAVLGVVRNPALPLGGYRGVYDAAYTANFVDPLKTPFYFDNQGAENREFNGATLRFETPLSGMTFSSTTAFRKFNTENFTDNDGGARQDLFLNTLDAKRAHSLQQEFKLSGKTDKLDWISGLSFYNNNEHQDAGGFITTGTLDTLSQFQGGPRNFQMLFAGLGAAGVGGLNGNTSLPWDETHYSDVHTRSSSVYGDAIWHMNDKTNVTTGLRYTRDEKTMTWFVPGRVSPELDEVLRTYGALVGLSPASFPSNAVFDAAAKLASKPVSRTKSWTDFSPRLVFDYKMDKDTLLFASISRGYQAGGFNIFTPPNPASKSNPDGSFEPEKMTNFEAGTKIVLPALRATVNASFFAYKFKNLQDIQLYNVGTIPTYNVITSDQSAHGIDLDGRIRYNSNVTMFGGLEYIDQTYDKYQRLDGSGKVTLDLGGQAVGTPKLTAMGGINVSGEMGPGRASINFQGTYKGANRCNTDSAPISCLSTPNIKTGTSTVKFDLRMGWDAEDHRWGAALIVNNVFDKRYVTSLGGQTQQYGMPYATITPPRAIGLELHVSM
ncbi:MAG: TonB-dependent receptor [Pseudomonadota bacterium]